MLETLARSRRIHFRDDEKDALGALEIAAKERILAASKGSEAMARQVSVDRDAFVVRSLSK
jgi:hypothetical protein